MDSRQKDLSKYRIQEAKDSLKVAKNCFTENFFKDSINLPIIHLFMQLKRCWHWGQ